MATEILGEKTHNSSILSKRIYIDMKMIDSLQSTDLSLWISSSETLKSRVESQDFKKHLDDADVGGPSPPFDGHNWKPSHANSMRLSILDPQIANKDISHKEQSQSASKMNGTQNSDFSACTKF